MDIEKELDKIFLSYNKILERFKIQKIKTKNGKEVTHKDLRYAISIMVKKHPTCRWKSEKIKSKRHYILIEGYYWLMYVYFQKEKKQIDADIDFFELRIKQYEELLKLESKKFFEQDIYKQELVTYFNLSSWTIEDAIRKMIIHNSQYCYEYSGELIISKQGIEWLCKNCFKRKYLEILEKYKMELTEKYIEAGYHYDNFFGKN